MPRLCRLPWLVLCGACASPAPAAAPVSPPPAGAAHGQGDARTHGGGYLQPEHSVGLSQSPINILTATTVPGRHAVALHYQTSREHVTHLDHTVRVSYDPGSSIDFDGTRFDFVQFHFHTPSEHLLDGVTYPMELHMVHTDHEHPDRYLVVGVLFKEGNSDLVLEKLLRDVPEAVGATYDAESTIDASPFFHAGEGYYHYQGSLTTPPYTESVDWLVLKQVHEAAAQQIESLNRLEGNNARHIQEARARAVDQN